MQKKYICTSHIIPNYYEPGIEFKQRYIKNKIVILTDTANNEYERDRETNSTIQKVGPAARACL